MSFEHYEVAPATLREDIEAAFSDAAGRGVDSIALQIGPGVRSGVGFIEILERAVRGHGRVRAIRLLHESPSFGFIASTLQLRLPGVSVNARSADSDRPARTLRQRSVCRLPASMEPEAVRAELMSNRAQSMVVVFAAGPRPPRHHVDVVAEVARTLSELEELVLVHDSSSVGFTASSMSLQLPNIRIRTAKELANSA